jgi:transglutaminase-like putative cysteine protease
VSVVARGEPNLDPLLFVLMLGVFFWFCGSFGAWRVFRHKGFWAAMLFPGIALLINAYYYIGPIHVDLYLAFFIIISLLLAMWIDHTKRQATWNLIRAQVPPNLALRLGRAGFIAALAIVLVAWATPALARTQQFSVIWDSVNDPFTSIGEWFGDLLAGLQVSEKDVSDFYGDELRLEGGQDPGNSLVMEVRPDGVPSNLARFYWRAQVYDKYQSGMWKATLGEYRNFNPNQGDLVLPQYEEREDFEVLFTPEAAIIRQVFLPSQPLWVDRVSQMRLVESGGRVLDVLSVSVRGIVFQSDGYRARASVAVPTGLQLAAAGENYPDWVTTSFLDIPSSVSRRTRDLAIEITEGLESPYRKAVAITSWLRLNFTYSRNTEAPPALLDPVDWFLFDYGIGFCNYYASAEVVMLRSLGIPARLATGYARGTLDLGSGVYEVRSRDAHAWPEVFFPGYGWIEFEPTPSQPPLYRPEARLATGSQDQDSAGGEFEDATNPGGEDEFGDNIPEEGPEIPAGASFIDLVGIWLRYTLLALPILLTALVVLLSINPAMRSRAISAVAHAFERLGVDPPKALRIELDQLPWQTIAGRIYMRWSGWLGRLGIELSRSQTPNERQAAFRSEVPDAAEHGQTIVEAYTRERYGGQEADHKQVRRAWWRMLPYLWKAWIAYKTKQRDKDIYVPGRLLR